MRAEGTNRSFYHTRSTSAPQDVIWRAWMDVARWKDWDGGLSDAEIAGPMLLGAEGTIFDRSGRRVPFEVIAHEPNRSYAIASPLPLGGRLAVERTLVGTEPTTFRHHVRFEGLGGWLLAPVLGRQFRRLLPEAMDRLASVCEGGQTDEAGTVS